MSQKPVEVENEQNEIKVLTSALMSAIGIVSSEEEKTQSLQIFLSKVYKKNTSSKQSKLNEIRLKRLNAFLFKVCQKFPEKEEEAEIIHLTMMGFLQNERNFEGDVDPFALQTGYWIAETMSSCITTPFHQKTLKLLQMLLGIKKVTLIKQDAMEEMMKNANCFYDEQIKREEEVKANNLKNRCFTFQQVQIQEHVLKQLNIERIFSNLFQNHEDKKHIVHCFIEFCKRIEIEDIRDMFMKIFVENHKNDQEAIEAILQGVESELFNLYDFQSIIKILFQQLKNNKSLLFKLKIKGLKCQHKYLQLIMEQTNGKGVLEMVQCFINSENINNYYLLYLINKSSERIPEQFTNLVFQEGKFTNRHGIICALSIFHNEMQHKKLIQLFLAQQEKMTIEQKVNVLKLVQFSLQKISKSSLLSQIIKKVSVSALDEESTLSFLTMESNQKKQTSKQEKDLLNSFLSREFGNTEVIYKIKLDLFPVCGRTIPYWNDLQKVNTLFEQSIVSIFAELPNVKEDLLEIVLMGINNRIKEQYISNQQITQNVIDWLLNIYKREMKKFVMNIQLELKRIGKPDWQHLVIALFEYNFQKDTDLCFDQNVRPITSIKMIRNLKGSDFSSYFINLYGEKIEKFSSLLKPKSVLIEIRKLLRILPSGTKQTSKKELKTILLQDAAPLFALKVIYYANSYGILNFPHRQKITQIVATMLSQIKPEYEFLEELEKRSSGVYIEYFSIYECIPGLLRSIHPETIKFISLMLSSKIPAGDEKKKKSRRKSDTVDQPNEEDKVLGILSNGMHWLFGDPNCFESYEDLLKIIQKLANVVHKIEIASVLTKWLSNLKIFHCETFKDWRKKVLNLAHLWAMIAPLVSEIISCEGKQRHFLIVTDLLNTLYELYKKEDQMIDVEQKLLETLLTIYKIKSKENREIDVEQHRDIPKNRIENALADFALPPLNEPHYYFCFDCDKNISNVQSDFIHRLHDKNYTGNSGSSDQAGKGKYDQREQRKQKNFLKEKTHAIRQYKDRERSRQRERQQRQRYRLQRLLEQDQENTEEMLFHLKMRQKLSMQSEQSWGDEVQLKKLKEFQNYMKGGEEDEEEIPKKQDIEDKFEVRSCSEKDFLIHQPVIMPKLAHDFEPSQFEEVILHQSKENMNLNPLFQLLARQLNNHSFIASEQTENIIKKDNEDPLFKVDVLTNKVSFFKNDIFKGNQGGNMPYGYGTYRSMDPNLPKRNLLTISEKVLSIGAGNNIMSFSFSTMKSRFLKKEAEKKFKELEPYEGFLLNRNNSPQNPILELSFSTHMKNILAAVSQSRITFQLYHSDGRVQKSFGGEMNYGTIIFKFDWIKGTKNMFSYLTKDLNLGIISKNFQARRVGKITVNRHCRDYSIFPITGKAFCVTVLDTEGKLYRSALDLGELSNTHVNLGDKQVSIPPFPDTKITSIFSYESFVLCALKNGSVCLLQFQDNVNLVGQPVIIPLTQKLIASSAAQEYQRIKQFATVISMRVIHKTANELFVTCLASREQNAGFESKNVGNFVLWKYNFKKKKSEVIVYHDQALTTSYDFGSTADKQSLIYCLQEDGELWCTKFSPTKPSIHDDEFKVVYNNETITEYGALIDNMKLMDQIKFIDESRKYIYRTHKNLTGQMSIQKKQNNLGWSIKEQDKKRYSHFISGLSFSIESKSKEAWPLDFSFVFLGKSYRYTLKNNRQIQIPLTIRQTLEAYFSLEPIELKMLNYDKIQAKNLTVYGLNWDEKSVYCDAVQKLFKTINIYSNYNIQDTHPYLLNQARVDIEKIPITGITPFLLKRKYTHAEANLFMKMELFRESITSRVDLTSGQLKEFYAQIKSSVLPTCEAKEILGVSLKKMCHKLTLVASHSKNPIHLSHPLHYLTHFDINEIFDKFSALSTEQTIQIFEALLQKFTYLLRSQADSFYFIIANWPKLIDELSSFYKKVMYEYRNYFKVTDKGIEKYDKMRMLKLCEMLIILMCESYFVDKNRGIENCERILVQKMQKIFCISNRQFYKELYLNPFQFMEPKWEKENFIIHAPFNYLTCLLFKEEEYIPQNQPIPEPKVNDRIFFEQQPEEQHKMAEEERQMEGQEQQYYSQEQLIDHMKDQEVEEPKNEQKEGQKIDKSKIFETLYSNLTEKEWNLNFNHRELCENVVIELFTGAGYLTQENAVFYLGMLYNMLLIIEKKQNIRRQTLNKIFHLIDKQIYNVQYSVLYMAVNMFMQVSYHEGKVMQNQSRVCKMLVEYYLTHKNSSFMQCVNGEVEWESSCEEVEKGVSLSSVLTLETFNIHNQAYQLKFMGNLFLNLRVSGCPELITLNPSMQSFMLKVFVKYNLRVYKNIIIVEGLVGELEKTKIDVGFQRIKKNHKKAKPLQMLKNSVANSADVFVESLNTHPSRINDLEALLGTDDVYDREILDLLQAYYSHEKE